MKIRTLRRNVWLTFISATIEDRKHVNARPRQQAHKDMKVTTTTVRSMYIELMSVDPSLTGHQKSKLR